MCVTTMQQQRYSTRVQASAHVAKLPFDKNIGAATAQQHFVTELERYHATPFHKKRLISEFQNSRFRAPAET